GSGAPRALPPFPTRRSSDLTRPWPGCGATPSPTAARHWTSPVTWWHTAGGSSRPERADPSPAGAFVGLPAMDVLILSLTCLVILDRKSTRLNSSHVKISYAV